MIDDDFTWSARAEPAAVRELRHAVSEFAARAGFTDGALDDLRACVSEAVTNAVVHAFRDGRGPGTVVVCTVLRSDELLVVVCDDGVGYGPRTDSPGIGLGIPTITALASPVTISRSAAGGTKICMSFTRASGPSRSGSAVRAEVRP